MYSYNKKTPRFAAHGLLLTAIVLCLLTVAVIPAMAQSPVDSLSPVESLQEAKSIHLYYASVGGGAEMSQALHEQIAMRKDVVIYAYLYGYKVDKAREFIWEWIAAHLYWREYQKENYSPDKYWAGDVAWHQLWLDRYQAVLAGVNKWI